MLAVWMILAPSLAFQEQPRPAVYKDNDLGLQFEHPANWEVLRTRFGAEFSIPLASGNRARATLVRTNFRDTKEAWQEIVRNVQTASRREVIEQTEETVLGVPMLLTRVRYGSDNGQLQMLAGLLFSRSPQKYNFQLEALESEMPEAETLWRATWPSLRTINNELPVPEGTPEETVPTRPAIEPAVYVLKPQSSGEESRDTIPVTAHTVTVEGGTVKVNLPEGWEIAPSATTGFVLRREGLNGAVTLDFVLGDRAFAPRVLGIRAGQTLARFNTVALRRDKTVGNNQSNATVSWVYRHGDAAGGTLAVLDAVGGEDIGVWALRYESSTNEQFNSDWPHLERLIQVLGRVSE